MSISTDCRRRLLHGELDAIYLHIKHLGTKYNYKVDALLICGDFQAMRNKGDVEDMACPTKYKISGGWVLSVRFSSLSDV